MKNKKQQCQRLNKARKVKMWESPTIKTTKQKKIRKLLLNLQKIRRKKNRRRNRKTNGSLSTRSWKEMQVNSNAHEIWSSRESSWICLMFA